MMNNEQGTLKLNDAYLGIQNSLFNIRDSSPSCRLSGASCQS